MNNSLIRNFFNGLLVVLVIISNLIGVKYIDINNMIISVNFITLPFVYLCFLMIKNISNKKEAWFSVLSAIFIQIFILISYFFVVNLDSQNIIPDFARYIDVLFDVDIVYILVNLFALILSIFVLFYIYEYFRIIGYKLFGTVISILSSFILYGLISIPIINYQYGVYIVLDMIVGHLFMSSFMTILITLIFYLLKDKDYLYQDNNIYINIPKDKKDKSIDEVIKITNINKEKKNRNKYVSKKKNGKNNNEKRNKIVNNSKKDVKK